MDSLKAMKVLSENGSLLGDSALLIPEIYLLKSVQYHSGDFVGVDKDETSSKNAVLTVMKFLPNFNNLKVTGLRLKTVIFYDHESYAI